jgi:serine/threonine-protein kinase RIO1
MVDSEPVEDYVVYDTITITLTRDPQGQKIINCVEDGSQFHFGAKLGKGSFSKVYAADRVWFDEEGTEQRRAYAIKTMHKAILKKQRCATYDEENNMVMMNNLEKIYKEIEVWRMLC